MPTADPGGLSDRQMRARIAELEDALSGAEARISDVDHRARNDFQLIWSILLMQTRRTPEGPARQALRRAADRMAAVAAVQKHLPRPSEPAGLDAQALLRDLAGEIAAGAGRADVRLQLELDPVRVAPHQGAPLGLIVEELLQNCLGHAFPGRAGRIEVSLREMNGGAVLTVADDGVGELDKLNRDGFGLSLVELLCKQLRGEFALAASAPHGVRAVMRFPEAT